MICFVVCVYDKLVLQIWVGSLFFNTEKKLITSIEFCPVVILSRYAQAGSKKRTFACSLECSLVCFGLNSSFVVFLLTTDTLLQESLKQRVYTKLKNRKKKRQALLLYYWTKLKLFKNIRLLCLSFQTSIFYLSHSSYFQLWPPVIQYCFM